VDVKPYNTHSLARSHSHSHSHSLSHLLTLSLCHTLCLSVCLSLSLSLSLSRSLALALTHSLTHSHVYVCVCDCWSLVMRQGKVSVKIQQLLNTLKVRCVRWCKWKQFEFLLLNVSLFVVYLVTDVRHWLDEVTKHWCCDADLIWNRVEYIPYNTYRIHTWHSAPAYNITIIHWTRYSACNECQC